MSQVLIISDSHFMPKAELLSFIKEFNDLEAVIHCGDIYMTYQDGDINLDCPFYICRGNNDFGQLESIVSFQIKDKQFVITHGHINHYAYKPLTLKNLQEEYNADIVCFGHTHIPYLHKEKGLMIINPGSLSLGRSYPRHNTYVLLDIDTLDIHFYDIKTKEELLIEED